MSADRDSRLLLGMMSGLAMRGVTLLAPLVTIPAALSYLGDRKFGLWMTFVSITAMAMFADFGIGNGLMTKLAQCKGRDDTSEARIYISNGYAILILSASALLVVVVTAIGLGEQVRAWLGLPPIYDAGDVRIAASCVFAFIVGLPLGLIQRIQYADQKVAVSNAWGLLAAGLSVVAIFVSIWLQVPDWGLVAASSMVTPLVLAAATTVHFGLNPEMRPSIRHLDARYMRQLARISIPFFALTVLTSISLNADSLIVASQISLEDVAALSVAAKIVAVLSTLVNIFCLPLWPANGEAIVRGDYRWVTRTTWRMSAISGVAVLMASIVLVLLIDAVTVAWLGRTFSGQRLLLGCLCASAVLTAIASPFFMVLNSVGQVSLQLVAYAAFLVVSVALKLEFAQRFGVVGVAAAGAIAYCLLILPAAVGGYMRIAEGWDRSSRIGGR